MNNSITFAPTNQSYFYQVTEERMTFENKMGVQYISETNPRNELAIATDTMNKISAIFKEINNKF
jgi:hypothetical protein